MSLNQQQVVLPINITLGLGAYTTKLFIGSEQVEVNVMIDSGSSTLAIDLSKYDPDQDQYLQVTTYAQDVIYGSGGWAGPVLKTHIGLNHDAQLVLNDAPIAITADSQQQNFMQADGIWGLAYHHLNKSYDVTEYLTAQDPQLKASHPWPFNIENDPQSMREFRKYLHQFPEHDLTPLFTDFESHQIIPNRFTLKTHRSIEYVPQPSMSVEDIENEPNNQGEFIIGGDLPSGSKLTTQVVHDAYYNTHLIACQVEGFDRCAAPPLDEKHLKTAFSNAIIDSGCSFLVLQKVMFAYVMDCMQKINPTYSTAIQAATHAYQKGQDFKCADLDLDQWPDVHLIFAGEGDQEVILSVPAACYWQHHAKTPNNWMFMIMDQLPNWPDQTLCGLPLMNNYTCVFDRSQQENGLVHWFAK